MFKLRYTELVDQAKESGRLNEVCYVEKSNHYVLYYNQFIAEAPKQGDQSFIDNDLPLMNVPSERKPFADKKYLGKNLFKRVHGVKSSCSSGSNIINFICPYNEAKIQSIEILWCPQGCYANLNIYDTPNGTISGVANAKLNQFGFSTNIREEYHIQKSQYDADLIKDLKIELEIFLPNSFSGSRDIGFNIELNELK